jgi:hypothetical protein
MNLKWEIFRYCLPPEAFVIWYEKCKEPGWPKHRLDEFARTLFDIRLADLKRLFEFDPVGTILMLYRRDYP